MNGVGADIIKVLGLPFSKGEVLYLFEILNKNMFFTAEEVRAYVLKVRGFCGLVFRDKRVRATRFFITSGNSCVGCNVTNNAKKKE